MTTSETNTISNTAYYCCGVRMDDAKRAKSYCNDQYAQRFMDKNGLSIYAPFRSEVMANISNITRCRILDDILKEEIKNDPQITVITIGSGFDTRPYRLTDGKWIELDEPHIIEYKNACLPINECQNLLKRISIDFSEESLANKLHLETNGNVIFVIEGVFMYLEPEAIFNTCNVLKTLYPSHILFCDLMNKAFFEKYAKPVHEKLVAAGGTFTNRHDNPEEVFINNNYELTKSISIIKHATDMGIYWDRLKIPRFISYSIILPLMKDIDGYTINRFEYTPYIQNN